ncbi:MAG: hypothetical protein IJ087_01045 [Eggerthellaceae bacterium]|nr:hypothetical protein [Eggerthellaceae bacterium]
MSDKARRMRNNLMIRLPDEESLEMVKTILKYESVTQCRKPGQVLVDFVLAAAVIDDYPIEVKERLDEIRRNAERRHIEATLS